MPSAHAILLLTLLLSHGDSYATPHMHPRPPPHTLIHTGLTLPHRSSPHMHTDLTLLLTEEALDEERMEE